MKPIRTPQTTTTFVLDGCEDLPATKCHEADGTPCIQTVWELTPAELETLKKTGLVYLLTVGQSVPPISMGVESFLEEGEENEQR